MMMGIHSHGILSANLEMKKWVHASAGGDTTYTIGLSIA
jgi:hypothetical protein